MNHLNQDNPATAMMDNQKIDVLRVEVLDNNVQKYSSTAVSGGGGYVASVNGTTYGQASAIKSTVEHHVTQDLWVKDLSSGQERQLSFQDMQIPARPGHRLWLAYDHQSQRWERIVNESTGDATYGNGASNPNITAQLRAKMNNVFLQVGLLVVPMINVFGGLVALVLLINVSSAFGSRGVPGAGGRFAKIMALGVGLFFTSYWFVIAMWVNELLTTLGWFLFIVNKIASLATAIVLTSMFIKSYRSLYAAGIEVIDDRCKRIDAALEEARAKQPVVPAV